MKIDRAVVTEQMLTVNLTTADLIKVLPPTIRKMIEAGATFEAAVRVPRFVDGAVGDANDRLLIGGADVPVVCTVFQRSAAKGK